MSPSLVSHTSSRCLRCTIVRCLKGSKRNVARASLPLCSAVMHDACWFGVADAELNVYLLFLHNQHSLSCPTPTLQHVLLAMAISLAPVHAVASSLVENFCSNWDEWVTVPEQGGDVSCVIPLLCVTKCQIACYHLTLQVCCNQWKLIQPHLNSSHAALVLWQI